MYTRTFSFRLPTTTTLMAVGKSMTAETIGESLPIGRVAIRPHLVILEGSSTAGATPERRSHSPGHFFFLLLSPESPGLPASVVRETFRNKQWLLDRIRYLALELPNKWPEGNSGRRRGWTPCPSGIDATLHCHVIDSTQWYFVAKRLL